MLDPEQIRQFLSVAHHKNFSLAAKELFVARSTISRSIARLEEDLGVQLLQRNRRSVTLTPAGEHLAVHGQELIWFMENLEAELHRFADNAVPCLKIVAPIFYSKSFLTALERYRHKHPSADVIMEFSTPWTIMDQVENGQADIGITYAPRKILPDMFGSVLLTTGEFVFLVSNEHPLAKEGSVDIKDPRLELPMMMEEWDYEPVMDVGKHAAWWQQGVQPRRVDSFGSLIMQVKANMGIAILPEHSATQVGYGCSILNIDGADTGYEVDLFYRKNTENPMVREFLQELTA